MRVYQTLCRYHYDPLDRAATFIPSGESGTRQFYLENRLVCEIRQAVARRFLRHGPQVFAARHYQSQPPTESMLLGRDQSHSVLHAVGPSASSEQVYTPYGYNADTSALQNIPGFNGEPLDAITGHYRLGNGYRAFNPALMRFNTPDSQSPFGQGGLNAYSYCLGDPVNRNDPDGHVSFRVVARVVRVLISLTKKQPVRRVAAPIAFSSSSIENAAASVTPTLSDMPAEAIRKIAGYLPSRDAVSLAMTSHRNYGLLREASEIILGQKLSTPPHRNFYREVLDQSHRKKLRDFFTLMDGFEGKLLGVMPVTAIDAANAKALTDPTYKINAIRGSVNIISR